MSTGNGNINWIKSLEDRIKRVERLQYVIIIAFVASGIIRFEDVKTFLAFVINLV